MRTAIFALFAALLGGISTMQISAQGTGFTYHGRLTDNGVPANGTYDFVFTVYDAAADGNAFGQPVTLDAIAVSAGQFTVQLDPGAGVFTGPARWLQISVRQNGVGAQTLLAPRQALSPTPYAIHAANAATAASAAGVASGTVAAEQLNTAGVLPTPGQILSYDGGNLLWRDPAIAAGNIFSLDGTSAYYNAGNVGIGTSTPAHRLSLSGGPSWTGNGWLGAVELPTGSALGWQANAAGQRFGMGHSGGGFYLFRTASNPGTTASPAIYDFVVNDVGNVGVGTTAPTPGIRLEVNGAALLTPGGSGGNIQFGTPSAETGMTIIGANRADVRFDGLTLKLLAGPGRGVPPSGNGIAINTSGNVGIGTTTPVAKLHAEGNAVQPRDKGGFVKAMAKINSDGSIAQCYNGVTGSSSGGCGFSATRTDRGRYTVNFGFQVDDRFVSVQAFGRAGVGECSDAKAFLPSIAGANVSVLIACGTIVIDSAFSIFVY